MHWINMRCLWFVALLLFSLCPAPLHAEPLSQEVYQERFDEGQTLFEARNYAGAYAIFEALFEENPEDPAVNFMMGRAAFLQGLMEEALMVYDRMLVTHPESHRVRLELARTFMNLGSLESARYHFQLVLATEPPPRVKERIQRYLKAADRATQKHRISGTLRFFAGWDDNPKVLPTDRTLIIPILGSTPVTLEKKESDEFTGGQVRLVHGYQFQNPRLSWQSALSNYSVYYDTQGSKTLSITSVDTGPSVIIGNLTMKGTAGFLHMDRQYSTYLNAARLGVGLTHKLSTQVHYRLNTLLEFRDFDESGRDSWDASMDVTPFIAFARVGAGLRLRYEREESENNEFDLNRIEAEPHVIVTLPYKMTLRTSVGYTWSRYDAEYALFMKYRTDHLVAISTALSREMWRSADSPRRLTMDLDYRWSRASSSIDLYDYTQNRIQLAGTFMF